MYTQYFIVLMLEPIEMNSIHSQRFAEPSDVEEYMHISNLSEVLLFGRILW